MRILLAFLLISLPGALSAQRISHSVFLSGGDSYEGADFHISYSIGEPLVEYLSTAEGVLSQGFQQDESIIVDVEPLPESPTLTVALFPNPARDNVQVRISDAGGAEVRIVDMLGRERWHGAIGRGEQTAEVSLQRLRPGMYLVHIRRDLNGVRASRLLQIQP